MSAGTGWGDEDLARRAADLAAKLPEGLAPLARIAYNYRWAWYPRGKGVFREIDPGRWLLSGENPVRLLQEASSEALARAAGDPDLLARATALEDAFAEDLGRPSPGPVAPERPIAFFCAEYVGLLYRQGYFRQRWRPRLAAGVLDRYRSGAPPDGAGARSR
jgi:Protein of unknown function (DUF3417)